MFIKKKLKIELFDSKAAMRNLATLIGRHLGLKKISFFSGISVLYDFPEK